MISRQLFDHLVRGATVMGAMAATLWVASAFTRTPPPEPIALMVPAAQADEAPGVIVAVPADDRADHPARAAFRVRRPLTWAADGRPAALAGRPAGNR